MWWVISSILYGGPTELFPIPASAWHDIYVYTLCVDICVLTWHIFLYLVCRHMLLNVWLLSERTTTHNALKRLFARVRADVLLQIEVLRKRLVAILTAKFLLRRPFLLAWVIAFSTQDLGDRLALGKHSYHIRLCRLPTCEQIIMRDILMGYICNLVITRSDYKPCIPTVRIWEHPINTYVH